MKTYKGKLVDVINKEIYNAEILVKDNTISEIKRIDEECENYIMPGFIDAHVHIESSMLIPTEFSKLVVKNGTVAVVSDPHEIANVLGKKGVEFMIENAKKTPLKVFFCIPSCVPATDFETTGAKLDAKDIEDLFKKTEIKILGEMMNFPGVVFEDKQVLEKLEVAKKNNALIDGHAPGLSGDDLKKYVSNNISTDHECFQYQEAIEKIKLGMKILIREGSAARNFDTLQQLITDFNNMCMLCTDDSHPDDIIKYGHINKIVKKAINEYKIDIFDVLKVACINPITHYNLPVGYLQKNHKADFIIVKDLENFEVLETILDGENIYSNNRILFATEKEKTVNNFKAKKLTVDDIIIKIGNKENIKVIEVIDKELITKSFITQPKTINSEAISDTDRDILKLVVYNRYNNDSIPSMAFINGFGIKKGAIASSVAHDSHNIIAVGSNDVEIVNAINEIIENQGGLCYVNEKNYFTLPLEFAGLMTQEQPEKVAEKYEMINKQVKLSGSELTSAFMTLSFMALLVIPELKLSDKGLFDGSKFEFTNVLTN